jgi:uncharacterized protein
MKTILVFLVMIFACSIANAQNTNPNYDKQLADSLGADEYGMKMYVLVILKTGPSQENNKKTVDSLFALHMKNIGRLADEGKLIVAGPIGKNEKQYRGIFILNVPSIEIAKELLDTDAAVKAKLLDADLYKWYGSAALPVYLPASKKVNKNNF